MTIFYDMMLISQNSRYPNYMTNKEPLNLRFIREGLLRLSLRGASQITGLSPEAIRLLEVGEVASRDRTKAVLLQEYIDLAHIRINALRRVVNECKQKLRQQQTKKSA